MAKSTKRGWEIVYIDGEWKWADTLEATTNERPCKRCKCMPTEEGYDACLGHIEGASSACCGHGVVDPILMMED